MAFTIIDGGSFTSDGTNQDISLPSGMDMFKTWNVTQLAATNPNTVTNGLFFGAKFGSGASTNGRGIKTVKTTAMLDSQFAANTGFFYYTTAPIVEAQGASAITDISLANPAVVTQNHSYSDGDFLRIYSTTGDLTIGGMVFEISSSTSGTQYTLLGLPNTAANGLANGTAGYTRRVSQKEAVDPQMLYITNISPGSAVTAAPAGTIISTSVDPSRFYVVGNKVTISCPDSFGMSEISGLTGTITSLNISNAGGADVAAYNMLVDIDSSTFTAFAFPDTTASPTARLFATLAPAGSKTAYDAVTDVQTGYEFLKTPFHTGQFTPFIRLIGGAQSPAGASADVINWACYKFET